MSFSLLTKTNGYKIENQNMKKKTLLVVNQIYQTLTQINQIYRSDARRRN